MEFFAFLSFLSCVVSILFGGFIFLKTTNNLPNKIFFLICLISSLLCFAEFELRLSETFERAFFWSKVYSFWPLGLAFLFHFIYSLNKKAKLKSASTIFIYGPAILVVMIELFTQKITVGPMKVPWGWTFQYELSWISILVAFWSIGILILSVHQSLSYYLKSNGQIKKQAYYIFVGCFLNALVSILFDVLFPAFELPIPELGNSFSSILLMILAYAIWKYQLFEVQPKSLAGKIVATISDSLLFVDSKLGIIEVNQAALELLRYNRDELLGQPIDIILNQSGGELKGEQIFKKLDNQGLINDFEVNFRTKDNQLVPVSLSLTLADYENQNKRGMILLGRNITERKKMIENLKQREIQLRKLNASKDKFFSILAHDLKNPFHAILSSSELLDSAYSELEEDERKELVSYIHQSSESIYSLLENLLTWSRSQQGNIVYRPVSLNLKKVVDESIYALRDMAARKAINLYTTMGEDMKVFADLDMLSIILRNLISNAIKFTPNGGEVLVSARKQDGNETFVHVSVEDTGVGIDENNLPNLFRIDRNVSTTGTNFESGTGLGLLLCKEFAEKLGSEISVESKQGEGSKFSFTLSQFSEN